jgi:hypothetical protein
MNTIVASFTRRHVPPRCSRITDSRPIAEKESPRLFFCNRDWGNSCTGSSTTCNTTSNPPINQHLRAVDLDYRPITIGNDPQGYSRNIAWDRANRITAITVPNSGGRTPAPLITVPGVVNALSLNQAFAYDQLDRLTNFNAGQAGATTLATGMALLPTEQFSYDAIGNRLARTTTAPGTSTNQTANYGRNKGVRSFIITLRQL